MIQKNQAKLEYFDIMRGPWDRQDHQKPFAVDFAKPIGAGFYPEDLDEEKLKKYIDENPEDADAVNNLVTMVSILYLWGESRESEEPGHCNPVTRVSDMSGGRVDLINKLPCPPRHIVCL